MSWGGDAAYDWAVDVLKDVNEATYDIKMRDIEPAMMTFDEYQTYNNPNNELVNAELSTFESINKMINKTNGSIVYDKKTNEIVAFHDSNNNVLYEKASKCSPSSYAINKLKLWRKSSKVVSTDDVMFDMLDNAIITANDLSEYKLIQQKSIDNRLMKILAKKNKVIISYKNAVLASSYWMDNIDITYTAILADIRGHGIGVMLASYLRSENKDVKSGAQTASGKRLLVKVWKSRVGEFLSSGIYSQLLKDGKIDKSVLDKILSQYKTL
jgi:hypothetical protein